MPVSLPACQPKPGCTQSHRRPHLAPRTSCRVLSAEVFGLQPAAHDKTLYPSDHAAVKATLEVSRREVLADLQEARQRAGQQQEAGSGSGGKVAGALGKSSL